MSQNSPSWVAGSEIFEFYILAFKVIKLAGSSGSGASEIDPLHVTGVMLHVF
jgi:hypothetical protein